MRCLLKWTLVFSLELEFSPWSCTKWSFFKNGLSYASQYYGGRCKRLITLDPVSVGSRNRTGSGAVL